MVEGGGLKMNISNARELELARERERACTVEGN